MRELDLSFNAIQSLDQFLNIARSNRELRVIRFNDNPFSNGKEGQYDLYMKRIYTMAEIVNGNNVCAGATVEGRWWSSKMSTPAKNLH